MFESSLALALFKVTILFIILNLSLALLTGDFIPSLTVLLGVCALVCAVMMFNIVRRLRVSMAVTQHDAGNSETTRLLTDSVPPNLTHQHIDLEPVPHSTTRALRSNSAPAYYTSLETHNAMSSEIDVFDGPNVDAQNSFATAVDGFEGDFTFGTFPFTSPPVRKIEILVTTETIVFEDGVPFILCGPPSPLVTVRDMPI
ncbi:hypothetical protein B0J17DRAFT_721375 [Rhizoctonia solani]|nr:hypothetical protein B0J17DRAFT_721375 [Rhizoctonia solani]